ncbi:MAG: hypothetical protein JSS20_21530, partial [Proteobacteria bacterium]|nr:hypothetical protein [Pseudomonadota bacterium]
MRREDVGNGRIERNELECGRSAAVIATIISHPRLTVLAAALVFSFPCLLWGLPLGADAPLHTIYQKLFTGQLWQGELYPRWLSELNKGLGSPIFFLQYPVPYFAAALLKPLLWFVGEDRFESHQLGVLVAVIVACTGLASRYWFRRTAGEAASTIGAIFFMSAPYFLAETVYGRAALGELCAFIFMPLGMRFALDVGRDRRFVVLLALALAGLLMSNAISFFLFLPTMAAYAILGERLDQPKLLRIIGSLAAATLLALALSALYLFPVIEYRRLFVWHQVTAHLSGYELAHYFISLDYSGTAMSFGARIARFAMIGMAVSALVAATVVALRASIGKLERIIVAVAAVLTGLALAP